jgi:hypothetical protein
VECCTVLYCSATRQHCPKLFTLDSRTIIIAHRHIHSFVLPYTTSNILPPLLFPKEKTVLLSLDQLRIDVTVLAQWLDDLHLLQCMLSIAR